MTFAVYPKKLDFGELPVGVRSETKKILLTNYGTEIPVSAQKVEGHFTLKTSSLKTLAAGGISLLKTNTSIANPQWITGFKDQIFIGDVTNGVFLYAFDKTGLPTLISANPAAIPGATGGILHDGRFLYTWDVDEVKLLQVDEFKNLVIKACQAIGVLDILDAKSDGSFLFILDEEGVTSYKIGHNGTLELKDRLLVADCLKLCVTEGKLLLFTSDYIKAISVNNLGKFRVRSSHTLSSIYSHVTSDIDFVYGVSTSDDKITSFSVSDNWVISELDSQAIPNKTVHSCYSDGGYIYVFLNTYWVAFSVNRNTGVLNQEKSSLGISYDFFSGWYDGTNLITCSKKEIID